MPLLNQGFSEGYETPPFPSLYWLIGAPGVVQPKYLYRTSDVWRFTVYWTLLFFEAAHLAVGFYAVAVVWWGGRSYRSGPGMGRRKTVGRGSSEGVQGGKLQIGMRNTGISGMWVVPVVYALIAGVEAIFAGSILGLLISAMYNAGGYNMSTWIPFVWALISLLVVVISSFSIQGGL